MGSDDYVPNLRMAQRMAHLWRVAMERPRFDNGDAGLTALFCQVAVSEITAGTTSAQLDIFEGVLTDLLMREYPYREEKVPEHTKALQYEDELASDYDPSLGLMVALRAAGLPRKQVPVKSHTRIDWQNDYIYASFGYSGRGVFHYPIDGGWWVTTLSGDKPDLDAALALVLASPERRGIEMEASDGE